MLDRGNAERFSGRALRSLTQIFDSCEALMFQTLPVGFLPGERSGFLPVSLFPGDHRIAQYADLFNFAFHDIPGLQIPRLRVTGKRGDAGDRTGGKDVAGSVAHRRIVGDNLWNLHRHFAGVRALPHFAVDAELHFKTVSVGNFVGRDDPRAERAKRIDSFAETEDAGLHLAALDIACSDVIENYVPAKMAGGFFGGKVFAALFQDDGQLQLVVQLLGQMLGINDRLFVADDGVDVLKKYDPRHDGMREACLGRFLVMLAEITRGVEKLFGNDRRLQFDFGGPINDWLAVRAGNVASLLQGEVESIARGIQTGVAAGEERPHIRGNKSVREALVGSFPLLLI